MVSISARQYARVYIQLRSRSLERPFDYGVPEELLSASGASLGVGSVVLVPFGRQKALGLVVEMTSHSDVPVGRLVNIEAVLDFPKVPAPLISLALWVSEYYYCPPATAIGLALPPGGLPALVRVKKDGQTAYILKTPPVKARVARFVRAVTPVIASGDGADTVPEYRRTAARKRLVDLLAMGEELPVSEALRLAGVGRSTMNSLAELGLLEITEREIRRDGLRYYGGQQEEAGGAWALAGEPDQRERLVLNSAQEQALSAIVARVGADEPAWRSRPILLEGVAGAGKTEVYLCAIEAVVAAGGRAIVLVPEISLTHQAVKRFHRRFGDRVGVLHSGLSLGERYDEFMRIRRGEVDVVIGPRSALFAPVPDLKLIIIDEENDGSYKQENDPRYDARMVALKRARLEDAVLVYGSATPSLESYHRVTDRFLLPERATGASMPWVEIVDMREENDHIFSTRLIEELVRNIGAGQKSILLLNSRGYARFLQCGQCGHVWKCGNCDVSLNIHHRINRLLCHHCGHAEEIPEVCPVCSSTDLRRWGVGTERLEQETRRLFPEAKVFRLDADTARGYGEGPRILEEFGRTEGAILVGTQMVAKGHHFPEVTLSAVINADLGLEFPEFRAEERTFSLLIQLAGRSGRSELPGRVLIQTWNGDIECIRMAAEGAMEDFYHLELERRLRLEYPPFRHLVNVQCQSREEGRSLQAVAFLKEKLAPVLSDSMKLLGPADLFRLKGWSRSHLLIKTGSVEDTLAAIKPVIEHYREPYRNRGVRIVVDVDPQWLS